MAASHVVFTCGLIFVSRFLILARLTGMVLGDKITMRPAVTAMILAFVVIVGSHPSFFQRFQAIGDGGEHLF